MTTDTGFFDEFGNVEKAKETALNYISGQLRTRREIEEKLRKKGFSEEDIDATMQFLQEYDYVNDAAYCKSWIHDRVTFHPCGRLKMEQELAKKISDRALIRESMNQFFPEETEMQLAVEAALQKIGSGRKTLKKDQLMRFLAGRGYPLYVARRVLEQEEIQMHLSGAEQEFMDDFMGF